MANYSQLIHSLILIQGIESKAPNHITFNVDKSYSFRPNYEQLDHTNSASTFDRLLQVLSEAIRRIFPGKTFFVINYDTHSVWFFNNRFLRVRCMASNPKMEYQVFLCIFQKISAMATLGLKEMGKFLWEGRGKKSALLAVSV